MIGNWIRAAMATGSGIAMTTLLAVCVHYRDVTLRHLATMTRGYQGRWNSKQLLSRDWVSQATSTQVPASISGSSGAYGFNWWCNVKDTDGHFRWPDAPAGTFAAEGHNNNRCFVIPEWRMVIVRMGLDASDHRTPNDEWSQFLALVGKALVVSEP